MKIEILKINRIWAEIKLDNGHIAKLKVDDIVKTKGEGHHELALKDISIENKYGKEVRFEVTGTFENPIFVKVKFNLFFNREARKLGAIFDVDSKSWIFPKMVEKEATKLEEDYSDLVWVELKAKDSGVFNWEGYLHFNGYPLARAWNRDSGAKLCEGVSQISGYLNSGGSMKNWGVKIDEQAVFRCEIARNQAQSNEFFECKILQ